MVTYAGEVILKKIALARQMAKFVFFILVKSKFLSKAKIGFLFAIPGPPYIVYTLVVASNSRAMHNSHWEVFS